MHPDTSIIVPTYNGAHRILGLLRSLEKQSLRSFDVIVVIDGSTDNTKEEILAAKLDLHLTIHEQSNMGRAGSRNSGIALAHGEYLIFFDDDVIVPETAVQMYVDRARKGQAVVAGALYPVYIDKNEFSEYATYLNDKWTGTLDEGQDTLSKPYLSANSFLITRSLAREIGGFNNVLTDAEDFDMAVRLWERGEQIYFAADILVGHVIQHGIAEYARRQVEYRHAQKKLIQVNPAAQKYLGPEHEFKGVKKLILRMLSPHPYLKLVDAGAFRFVPKHRRFRLYDILLTAYANYGRRGKSAG
jgi:glycosyltransferase involved in cell wall biosynthesis